MVNLEPRYLAPADAGTASAESRRICSNRVPANGANSSAFTSPAYGSGTAAKGSVVLQ